MRLEKDLDLKLRSFNPDVVGLTAFTCDVNIVGKILEVVKAFRPSIQTVVGGHHATFQPEDFSLPQVDVVLMGFGDETFPQYIDALSDGSDFRHIPNLGIVSKGKMTFTQLQESKTDLDALPFPARHLTKRYHKKYRDSVRNRVSLVLTSRGCPFRCTFCACWKLMDGKYMVRSNQSIVDELKSLPHSSKMVYFADDNTLHNVPRAQALSNLIRESRIRKKFQMYARVDTIVKHPDLIENLREAGLTYLTVGLESISDQALKKFKKNSTVAKNDEAIRILKKLGIGINAHFLVDPEFTISDFNDLYRYVKNRHLYRVAYPVLTPLPGTELYEEVEHRMVIKNTDFFDFCHALIPTRLDRDGFYNQMAQLYRKSYGPGRMARYYKDKLMNVSTNPDYYAFHSDGMGFFKLLIVQLFGFSTFLKFKHATRDEPPLLKPSQTSA